MNEFRKQYEEGLESLEKGKRGNWFGNGWSGFFLGIVLGVCLTVGVVAVNENLSPAFFTALAATIPLFYGITDLDKMGSRNIIDLQKKAGLIGLERHGNAISYYRKFYRFISIGLITISVIQYSIELIQTM